MQRDMQRLILPQTRVFSETVSTRRPPIAEPTMLVRFVEYLLIALVEGVELGE